MRTMPLPRHLKRLAVGLVAGRRAIGLMTGSFIRVRSAAFKSQIITARGRTPGVEMILRRRQGEVVRRAAPRLAGSTWADQPGSCSAASAAMTSFVLSSLVDYQGSVTRKKFFDESCHSITPGGIPAIAPLSAVRVRCEAI